ncbi:MAG: helix-turn-helix domain-containing protein [Candidatus Dormibacteraeota bacterium]|nr:helix-turn-helix domain-containing protein [Candidatus Dormibacteraeota bacterium]
MQLELGPPLHATETPLGPQRTNPPLRRAAQPTPQVDRRSISAPAAGRGSAPDGDRHERVWNGEDRCFNTGTLREVMVMRGLTADSLALAAGVSRGTIYNALTGRPTRLATARRILEALATTAPTLLFSTVTAGI